MLPYVMHVCEQGECTLDCASTQSDQDSHLYFFLFLNRNGYIFKGNNSDYVILTSLLILII